jgi:hypothetical protein
MRMSGTNLKSALRDLAAWCEGDELLHFRFRPGSTVEDIGGRREIVDWLSIQATDGQSFSAGVLVGRLVTRRCWFEGMDAWEAAGRPSDPALQPRYTGMAGEPRDLGGSDVPAKEFEKAVLDLHASIRSNSTRYGSAEREALADAVENAMRGIIRDELSAAGVPDWLLEETGHDEVPAPGF